MRSKAIIVSVAASTTWTSGTRGPRLMRLMRDEKGLNPSGSHQITAAAWMSARAYRHASHRRDGERQHGKSCEPWCTMRVNHRNMLRYW